MKIFLTGAAGYIGGTVAGALSAAGHQVIGLVRSQRLSSDAEMRALGIEPVYGELDDAALVARLAREADAVINAANVDHRSSVEAILSALAGSGKTFIQTSGSGITADRAGGEATDAVFEDDDPVHPLPARAGRVALNAYILAAANDGIRTAVIAPPMVYGKGAGIKHNSIQVPAMIKVAKKYGVGKFIGIGANRWSNVHVLDLADLYLAVVERGRPGQFYYAENGENPMKEVAESISRMLGYGGRADGLTLAEAVAEYGEMMSSLSLGSNSRVRAARAHHELGWSRRCPTLIEEIEQGSYVETETR